MDLSEERKKTLASKACDLECLDKRQNVSVHRVLFIGETQSELPQVVVLKRQEISKGVKEAEIYSKIRNISPNLLEMYFHTIYGIESYLFLESAESDLSDYIRNKRKSEDLFVSKNHLIRMFIDLASAVKILHDHDIAHRDIKPKNVFIVNGILKLGDFGISKCVDKTAPSCSAEGTLRYMSPELRDSYNSSTDTINPFKDDIWALGITLIELALLEEVHDPQQAIHAMEKQGYCRELIDILLGALHVELSERSSAEDIHRQLVDFELNNAETEAFYFSMHFDCRFCGLEINDFFVTTPCMHRYHSKCFRNLIQSKMKNSNYINCLECQTQLVSEIPFLVSLNPSRSCIKKIILIYIRKKYFVCNNCGVEDKNYRRVDEKLKSFTIKCKNCHGRYCSLCRTSSESHDFRGVIYEVISEFI